MNYIVLLEKNSFERSCVNEGNREEIKYGTSLDHPLVSYGPFKVKTGYNDSKWIFERNPEHFEPFNSHSDYETIKILIEHNSGNAIREKELFEKGELSLYVVEHGAELDDNFFNKFQKDLFCAPEEYSLTINLEGERVKNINLKKALFYGIDKKSITNVFLHPTLDYMNDTYCDKNTSIFPYNKTEKHQNNILECFRKDLLDLHINTENIEQKIINLKNNLGYDQELAKMFFHKYITETNSQGDIILFLATRDGVITNEKIIGQLKEQIEKISNDGNHKIKIEYKLNDFSSSDINIKVAGRNPECFISEEEKKRIQDNSSTRRTYKLSSEQNKQIPELEKKVYQNLFMIPLYQPKQVNFLKNVETEFNKYYSIFGFKNQSYDSLN
ncbi:ABC transporter substrate-binding protein ['Prunus avium' virescence phytoplasma]|uniref:ABC transporter substrate-binding protein n=1 Tax='Prunus avium' virescence phytoplasma TaxID=2056121 RepID=UPI003D803F68